MRMPCASLAWPLPFPFPFPSSFSLLFFFFSSPFFVFFQLAATLEQEDDEWKNSAEKGDRENEKKGKSKSGFVKRGLNVGIKMDLSIEQKSTFCGR